MISKRKQAALDKHRSIILAILSYFIEREGGNMVYDGHDPIAQIYLEQQVQAEKYYQEQKLDRLQYHLKRLSKTLANMVDFDSESYIKEKTGYEIDIFGALHQQTTLMLAQNEILNEKEFGACLSMLHYEEHHKSNKEVKAKLETLIHSYFPKHNQKETGYTKIISKVEKDGIEEIRAVITSGPEPKLWEIEEIVSPDGKRHIQLSRRSDGKHHLTSLSVQFKETSGVIYEASGIYPAIKAYWKDNQTIVVSTKKAYQPNTQYRQLSHYNDSISIEYIEEEGM